VGGACISFSRGAIRSCPPLRPPSQARCGRPLRQAPALRTSPGNRETRNCGPLPQSPLPLHPHLHYHLPRRSHEKEWEYHLLLITRRINCRWAPLHPPAAAHLNPLCE
jgi:hypothetical protein